MKENKGMYNIIIFDLDGTLLDTSPGIFNSVRYTERELGLAPIPENELRDFLGPPPKKMYEEKYGLSERNALLAAQKHREYALDRAVYEAKIYAEINTVLEQVQIKAIKAAVATLKKQEIAEKILENFGILHYFDAVVGMDESESLTKCETIQTAMSHANCYNGIMVGDSWYDYDGAVEAGIDFVGALYGFGFDKSKVYRFKTVRQPLELLKMLDHDTL